MDFRHPNGQHIPVLLPRRSLLQMTGEARYVWTHGITPRKSDIIPVPTDVAVTSGSKNGHIPSPADSFKPAAGVTQLQDPDLSAPTSDVQDQNGGQVPENASNSKTRLTLTRRDERTSFTFRKILRGPCRCSKSWWS